MSRSSSALGFFLLAFALAVPFFVLGAIGVQVLPGLPVSGPFLAFCPVTAAVILTYREEKTAGVGALLKRSFDYERITSKVWYVPALLLIPGVSALAYGWMRWMGVALPSAKFSFAKALGMAVAFFVAGLGEELGWTGYALDRMQRRWSALEASILLGLVWVAFHLVPLIQVGRAAAWIAGWCLFTVALRIILTWLYNNTGGSVFAVALAHASANLATFLFPSYGSHYDPRFTGPIVAIVAVIVTVVWGPRTLARRPNING